MILSNTPVTAEIKPDPDLIGEWSGKKCPSCGSELLVNKIGNYWCSLATSTCNYGLDSTESPDPYELEDVKKYGSKRYE